MRAHVRGDAGEQEPQTVEQFGHRAERRTDARHRGPLVQGQRGRHVQYFVHLGATGLGQAASRVRGQRLQVAPRTFRIQHAERQRALSRTGDAGHAHQFAQRNVDVDVLEVMHARPAHFDRLRPLIVGHARHCSAAARSAFRAEDSSSSSGSHRSARTEQMRRVASLLISMNPACSSSLM